MRYLLFCKANSKYYIKSYNSFHDNAVFIEIVLLYTHLINIKKSSLLFRHNLIYLRHEYPRTHTIPCKRNQHTIFHFEGSTQLTQKINQ
jgi:hypothetical protein